MQFARIGTWAAIAMGIALSVALIHGNRMPAKVGVTRSIEVAAPPAALYPLIADFKNGWARWNAFDDEDPAIAYRYEGPDRGIGAIQDWTSKKIGDGRMTLTRADSLTGVGFKLEMGPGGKDFRRTGTLAMREEGSRTLLTWTDSAELGKSPTQRLMGPVLAKMTAKSLEASLANLKKLAEAAAATAAADSALPPPPK